MKIQPISRALCCSQSGNIFVYLRIFSQARALFLFLWTRGCSKMAEKQSVRVVCRRGNPAWRAWKRPQWSIRKLSIGISNRNRFQLHTSEPGRETRPILVSTWEQKRERERWTLQVPSIEATSVAARRHYSMTNVGGWITPANSAAEMRTLLIRRRKRGKERKRRTEQIDCKRIGKMSWLCKTKWLDNNLNIYFKE